MWKRIAAGGLGLALAGGLIGATTLARPSAESPAGGAAEAPGEDRRGGEQPGRPDFGRMLVEGLEASEGCLGVELAQLQGGKNSIIAWFEDVEAARRWYHSDTHRFFMGAVGARPEARTPLEHVGDPETPVMVIATVTFGGERTIPGPMPISQISIEMYAPLPGGAAINGRLAPEGFEIPHFRSGTIGGAPEPAEAEAARP